MILAKREKIKLAVLERTPVGKARGTVNVPKLCPVPKYAIYLETHYVVSMLPFLLLSLFQVSLNTVQLNL